MHNENALENSFTVLQRVKHCVTIWPSDFTLGYISNKNENIVINDNNVNKETFYTYYIVAEYLSLENNTKEKSNVVKMYIT